jgi:hypothetical protein
MVLEPPSSSISRTGVLLTLATTSRDCWCPSPKRIGVVMTAPSARCCSGFRGFLVTLSKFRAITHELFDRLEAFKTAKGPQDGP